MKVVSSKHATVAPKAKLIKRQAGFSMVEIGLGLVIMTVLGVGVISYFGSNTAATQANQLGSDMTSLIGKVKSAYAGDYGSVTNAKLNTGGFFKSLPALNNVAGVVSTNLGGGTLTVAPGTVTTANDSVQYTVTQLPDSACLPLVTQLVKSATVLKVGANTVKAVGAAPDSSKITCANDNTTMVVIVQ